MKPIIGYGGGKGGGGGGSATIARDSLRSKSFARVLDLISEGEIEGLVNGAQSIYLDGTPLQNADGTFNFKGVTWVTRNGTQTQPYVEGFAAVESTTQVGVEAKYASSVTRTFTNPNIDEVRVTVGIPQLTSQDLSSGSVYGTSVGLAIDVQTAGGGFVRQVIGYESSGDVNISGGIASGYGHQMTVSLSVLPTTIFSGVSWPVVLVEYRVNGGAWVTAFNDTINVTGYSVSSPVQPSAANIEMRATVVSGSAVVSIASGTITSSTTSDTITGKTGSRYQRSYSVRLSGNGPWDIRLVRLTPDSTTDALQNKTFWDTATEVIHSKLRYPNSALVGLSCDASQFSNIPTRAYDMRLLKVRVPSNYNPLTRVYTGSWDGTFKVAWTDNPAWCFYDMLTTARYGLGGFINASQVDKWALYAIGQYCDQYVPDGYGGMEPRFTCNLYLQTRAEAFKVMQDMASMFRGMIYWSSGSITAVQDAPTTASYIYTAANVIDGMFNYSGSSAKTRHTVALVTWNDMDDMGKQKVEYVEDVDGIARYGVITTETAAIGCTSRGQANRAGQWLLKSERLETETVAFKVGLDGMISRPGQVIKIADPARAGVRYAGRITTPGTSSIVIDSPVTLTAGTTYTLATIKADGTVQESAVVHSGGTLSTLNVSPAFSEAPGTGTMWAISSEAVALQQFRVLSVVENEKNEFEIIALEHEPSKFAAIEQNLKLEARSISVLSTRPAAPTNLAIGENLYIGQNGVRVRMVPSWSHVDTATSYVVTYSAADGNLSPEISVATPSVDLGDVDEGSTYTVNVVAVNSVGIRGPASSVTYTIQGKTAPPSNVTGFVVARNGDILNFSWAHIPDVDLSKYEIRFGEVWGTAVQIGATAANGFSFQTQRGGTFLIKAVDTSGNYSVSEAAVIVSDVSGINIVLDYNDSVAGFPGVHDNTYSLGITQSKQWVGVDSWDSAGTWDDSTFVGGVTITGDKTWANYTDPWSAYTESWAFNDAVSAGVYTTAPIDIGFIATSVVSLETAVGTITRTTSPWSDFTEPWSTYGPPEWTWMGKTSGITATFEISTSTDGIAYTPWQQFVQGAYNFRYAKIRVSLATDDLMYLPYMTKLIAHVDVPDRVDHFEDVAVPVAGVTLTFTPAFVGVKTVQATLQSAVSGDRFTVTAKSNTAVTLKVFDSAGAAKTGVVDVDVFGYGRLG